MICVPEQMFLKMFWNILRTLKGLEMFLKNSGTSEVQNQNIQ